ncbi:MAG: tetratricopeptide repeat protein [Planctomycetota bacterium]
MRLFLLALGAILILELVLLSGHPTADPPVGFSRDHSFNIDGYWYLADARSAVDGSSSDVVHSYHRPWITAPAQWFYEIAGVQHFSSRLLNLFAALATVALLGFWMRRTHGPLVGILGALLLALDPAWLACARSSVVYPWVAFWLLAVVAIGFGGGWKRWATGVGLMVLCAWTVKSLVVLAAPAFLLDAALRARREGWFRSRQSVLLGVTGVAVVGAALGPWTLPTFWRRVVDYMFGAGFEPWKQWLEYEARSGLFSSSPTLVALAFGGLFIFSRTVATTSDGLQARPLRDSARAVHLTTWGVLFLFAVSRYTPLRYHIPLYPFLVFAAGAPLAVWTGGWKVRPLALRGWRHTLSSVALGGGAVAIVGWLIAAARAAEVRGVLGMAVVAVVLLAVVPAAWFMRRRGLASDDAPRLALRPAATFGVAGIALFAVIGPVTHRVADATTYADHSLVRASAQLSSVVVPAARLAGPYAHVLTTETGHAARQLNSLKFGHGELKRTVERLGCSHLATYHPPTPRLLEVFRRDGTPIEVVERFQLRDRSAYLYRFTISEVPRSTFEEGVHAFQTGDAAQAEACFRVVLTHFPSSAPAWTKLGVVLARNGSIDEALACFERANELDPKRIEALVELANIYGSNGYLEEAYDFLERATKAAPYSEHLREQFQRLQNELELGEGAAR